MQFMVLAIDLRCSEATTAFFFRTAYAFDVGLSMKTTTYLGHDRWLHSTVNNTRVAVLDT